MRCKKCSNFFKDGQLGLVKNMQGRLIEVCWKCAQAIFDRRKDMEEYNADAKLHNKQEEVF